MAPRTRRVRKWSQGRLTFRVCVGPRHAIDILGNCGEALVIGWLASTPSPILKGSCKTCGRSLR